MSVLARKLMDAPARGIEFVGRKMTASDSNGTFSIASGFTGGIDSVLSDDDLIVAVSARGGSNQDMSITDGVNNYTTIGAELYQSDSTSTNLHVAYKFRAGDTSLFFQEEGVWIVYAFRGVDKTTPMDVTPVTAQAGNTGLPNPGAITPSTPGAWIVCVGASGNTLGTGAGFSASYLTNFATQIHDYGTDTIAGIGYIDDWVSGAYDPAVWVNTGSPTLANSNYAWCAVTFALRPA